MGNIADMNKNPTDTNTITRTAKLSDAQINQILGPSGGIRWLVIPGLSVMYRMSGAWSSTHGKRHTCSYKVSFMDAYSSTPKDSPSWDTSFKYAACGGMNDGGWKGLSGIHTADDNDHMGAHHNGWGKNGYVYIRSKK